MNVPKLSKVLPLITIIVLSAIGGFVLRNEPFKQAEVKGTTDQTTERQATLTVQDINYQLNFQTGDKLVKALNDLKQTNSQFTFEYIQYDFGAMITSINNITPDQNHFWKLEINDQDATVGISDYQLNPNDKIKFVLEKITF